MSESIRGIPDDIDSSGWSTNSHDFGMSAKEYIQSETRAFFQDFIGRAGINHFFHFKGLSNAADKWVVSPNNDTIYSLAIVNARNGFTLSLPEVGDRFVAAQITTENHLTPFYIYCGSQHVFSPSDFDTDFVAIAIRMGTNGTESDVAYVVNDLQPQYEILGAAPEDDLTRPDLEKLARLRTALIGEYSKLPNSFGAMQKKAEDVRDWEYFTYVTAGALGLSMDENAMYANGGPANAKGGTCYRATFPPVPAKAFFSITLYGPDKYLMSDEFNIVSSNRGIEFNDDGSFTVVFGGKDCRGDSPNFAFTPEDGWSFLLRAYAPDVERFKAYQLPEIKEIGT